MLFFLVFLVGIGLMYFSSDWIIRYGLKISRTLGVSTLVIGFIFVSVATSLPELFVTGFSVYRGEPGLAVGNFLGSNMFDLTVIMPLVVIFGGAIYLKKRETIDLIELLFISSVVTIMIFQTGSLTPLHGLILIVFFLFLVARLYRKGRVSKEIYDGREEKKATIIAKFAASMAVLAVAAQLIVQSALQIADFFSVTATTVGILLVGISTSMPELSIELKAVKTKQYAFALGDLFGSAVTNVTLGLGALSLISPTHIDVKPLETLLPFLLISIMFIWYTFNEKKKITKYEGGLLLGIYILFLITTFLFGKGL